MGSRNEEFTLIISHAFKNAQDKLSGLAAEIRESADGMKENYPSAELTERYAEAADALESIDLDVEVPKEIADDQMTYKQDTRKGQTRATDISNLAELLNALFDGLPERSVDETEEMGLFRQALDEALGYLEGIEL